MHLVLLNDSTVDLYKIFVHEIQNVLVLYETQDLINARNSNKHDVTQYSLDINADILI